jgi:hypothetical protein
MLGVDDHSMNEVDVIPRIPPDWKGIEADNRPIRTQSGMVRAKILYQNTSTGAEFSITLGPGAYIDDLKVRMPQANGSCGAKRSVRR